MRLILTISVLTGIVVAGLVYFGWCLAENLAATARRHASAVEEPFPEGSDEPSPEGVDEAAADTPGEDVPGES